MAVTNYTSSDNVLSATTATQVVSSTSLVDVTGMSFPVGIGTYTFDIRIVMIAQSTSSAPTFSVNVPASSLFGANIDWPSSNEGRHITASDALPANGAPFFNNTSDTQTCHITGIITTTAAGNIKARAKVALAANTVTIQIGSIGTVALTG